MFQCKNPVIYCGGPSPPPPPKAVSPPRAVSPPKAAAPPQRRRIVVQMEQAHPPQANPPQANPPQAKAWQVPPGGKQRADMARQLLAAGMMNSGSGSGSSSSHSVASAPGRYQDSNGASSKRLDYSFLQPPASVAAPERLASHDDSIAAARRRSLQRFQHSLDEKLAHLPPMQRGVAKNKAEAQRRAAEHMRMQAAIVAKIPARDQYHLEAEPLEQAFAAAPRLRSSPRASPRASPPKASPQPKSPNSKSPKPKAPKPKRVRKPKAPKPAKRQQTSAERRAFVAKVIAAL